MTNGVSYRNAAHGATAAVVEIAQSSKQVLPQAPNLAAIEQDAETQGHVNLPFDFGVKVLVGKHVPEGSERRRGSFYPLVDISIRG